MVCLAIREHCMSHFAQRKRTILEFGEKHGLVAAQDAFAVNLSTLYSWRQR